MACTQTSNHFLNKESIRHLPKRCQISKINGKQKCPCYFRTQNLEHYYEITAENIPSGILN